MPNIVRKMSFFYSPNFDLKKRHKKNIKYLIFHYTGMKNDKLSINRLTNFNLKVSCHYYITKEGKLIQIVPDLYIAWHAGKSYWKKYKNLNKNSIGIELVNKGHQFGYTTFKKKQLLSLQNVCRQFIKKYKIKRKYIVGHSDIAPLRKIDPGEKFPWKKLADKKIGIWHNCKENILKKSRKVKISSKLKSEFIISLKKIGYCFNYKRRLNFSKTIKSFQRHYRKELINGVIDRECWIIAKNISKKI